MVRSITQDPFHAIRFLEEEMGKITSQNQLFNEKKRDLVARYIDYYVKDYNVIGPVGMRSTHVEINNEKLCGLTFVTGIVPQYKDPRKSTYSINLREGSRHVSSAIIFLPIPLYKHGEFIILEDAYAHLFSQIHTIFDEDLKMEKDDLFLPNIDNHPTIKDDEDWVMLTQYYDLQALTSLFKHLLNLTHYSTIQGNDNYTLRYPFIFKGVPKFDFLGNSGIFSTGREFYGIRFHKLIMLTSIRRLLKLLYPGTMDGENTFDKQITRRFFAQYIYLDEHLNADMTEEDVSGLEDVIRCSVDNILELVKKLEDSNFMETPLEIKYILLDEIYRDMFNKMQLGKEKDDGISKDQETETRNNGGVETAITD